MKYLSVRNWEKFQHYKAERPSWIKFYASLLHDYAFLSLSDEARGHLCMIWLLAAETGNRIPADPEWVRQQIGSKKAPNLEKLVNLSFLRPCNFLNNSEKSCEKGPSEVETETEKETETEGVATAPAQDRRNGFKTPTFDEVRNYIEEKSYDVDPVKWFGYYTSNGWKVGRNPMRDWKAAVITWTRKDRP